MKQKYNLKKLEKRLNKQDLKEWNWFKEWFKIPKKYQAKFLDRVLKEIRYMTENKPIFNIADFILNRSDNTTTIIIESPRNNGKTTSSFNYLRDHILNKGLNFVWVRNLDIQAQQSAQNFRQRFFNLGYDVSVANGEVKDITKKIRGLFLSLNASRKARSGIVFNDKTLGIKTDIIFYDEYNELETKNGKVDYFKKLIQLVESIQRDNKDCLLVMLGNRDTPNNPFLHKLGIKPETNFKTTKIDEINTGRGVIKLVRVGVNDYKIFRPAQSISGSWASLDEQAEQFLIAGAYFDLGLENVLNFKRFIEPTFQPIMNLSICGINYVLGEFIHYEKQNQYALCKNAKCAGDGIAFDKWSELLFTNSYKTGDKILQAISDLIFESYKNRILFFDEFETLDNIAMIFKEYKK